MRGASLSALVRVALLPAILHLVQARRGNEEKDAGRLVSVETLSRGNLHAEPQRAIQDSNQDSHDSIASSFIQESSSNSLFQLGGASSVLRAIVGEWGLAQKNGSAAPSDVGGILPYEKFIVGLKEKDLKDGVQVTISTQRGKPEARADTSQQKQTQVIEYPHNGESMAAPEAHKAPAWASNDFAGLFKTAPFTVIRIQAVTAEVNWFEPYIRPVDSACTGTGFLVQLPGAPGAEPIFITNAHVVRDAHDVQIQLPGIGERFFQAYVPLICDEFDLAVVQLDNPSEFLEFVGHSGGSLVPLEVVDTPLILGLEVASIGFPLGSNSLKLSRGVISGTEEVGTFICYQTTAPISPGSSGGPLFARSETGDMRVIGATFASAAAHGAQNLNYVVPAVAIVQVLAQHQQRREMFNRQLAAVASGALMQIHANGSNSSAPTQKVAFAEGYAEGYARAMAWSNSKALPEAPAPNVVNAQAHTGTSASIAIVKRAHGEAIATSTGVGAQEAPGSAAPEHGQESSGSQAPEEAPQPTAPGSEPRQEESGSQAPGETPQTPTSNSAAHSSDEPPKGVSGSQAPQPTASASVSVSVPVSAAPQPTASGSEPRQERSGSQEAPQPPASNSTARSSDEPPKVVQAPAAPKSVHHVSETPQPAASRSEPRQDEAGSQAPEETHNPPASNVPAASQASIPPPRPTEDVPGSAAPRAENTLPPADAPQPSSHAEPVQEASAVPASTAPKSEPSAASSPPPDITSRGPPPELAAPSTPEADNSANKSAKGSVEELPAQVHQPVRQAAVVKPPLRIPHFQFKIAPIDSVGIEANSALYRSHGCSSGVFLSRILNTSVFRYAKPEVTEGSFLTSVDGVPIDSFGMGRTDQFLHDPTPFESLMMMKVKPGDIVKLTTCSKGADQKEVEHIVSMEWDDAKYKMGITNVVEPFYNPQALQYETFAGITLVQMTANHIIKILKTGVAPTTGRWLLPENMQKPRLLVTHVDRGKYAGRVIAPGMVVDKVNGQEVGDLLQYRTAFMPAQGSPTWELLTDQGVTFAADFKEELISQLKQGEAGLTYKFSVAVVNAAQQLVGRGQTETVRNSLAQTSDAGSDASLLTSAPLDNKTFFHLAKQEALAMSVPFVVEGNEEHAAEKRRRMRVAQAGFHMLGPTALGELFQEPVTPLGPSGFSA